MLFGSERLTAAPVLAVVLAVFFRISAASGAGGEAPARIGIDERLGSGVPGDIGLVVSDGTRVTLGEVMGEQKGPTVLSLAYFTCTNVCIDLMSAVAEVVSRADSVPGRDYRILTVSFDPEDTPEAAARKKRDYLKAASTPGREVGPDAWLFLTGDEGNIDRLASAIGFSYRREEGGFNHPVALVFLSEEGRIVRYLYGTDIKPFDIDMALSEASEGKVGPTIPRVAKLCFTYDPERGTYAFSFLRVAGGAILIAAGGFAVFLIAGNRKGRRRNGGT